MQFEIKQGMNQDILKSYPDNHFDSIVTDPPYGIEFLGKHWDSSTGAVETWQECLRVLKPGGYLLAFSAARTYHHLATNIESVGFEIRDQIMWIYASGFPKAQDIGKAIQKRLGVKETKPQKGMNAYANHKPLMERMSFSNLSAEDYPPKNEETICTSPEAQQWSGWKTALKPGHEPIVMARKPFKGSTIDNVLEHGTGALNIDASRIGYEDDYDAKHQADISKGQSNATNGTNFFGSSKSVSNDKGIGRFPSNVLGDIPDYQKYFYCPKVSRKERHTGFEAPPPEPFNSPEEMQSHPLWDPSIGTNSHRLMKKIREHQSTNNQTGTLSRMKDAYAIGNLETHGINVMGKTPVCLDCNKTFNGTNDHTKCDPDKKGFVEKRQPTTAGNNHPTVKPVELMKYLIKLVTPPNSKVLDPFTGSGSTGMAAVELGHDFTGCELDPAYVSIAETRIRAWNDHGLGPLFE